jgi:hypothetical protein
MTVASWLDTFDTIAADGFRNTQAAALANFVRRYGVSIGQFVEGRGRNDKEIVILDLMTGAPQRPAYSINQTERIGIFFAGNAAPLVMMFIVDPGIQTRQ